MTIRQAIATITTLVAFAAGMICSKFVYGWELPKQAGPLGVPPTSPEIALGARLFFDPILSANGTVACASCHQPEHGYTDGLSVAVGINGQAGTRNTPTLLNVGYVKPMTFWDGRNVETTDQAVLPITNPIEMGNQTLQQVINRLRLDSKYLSEFARVFPVDRTQGSPITVTNLARAIACFEATLNTSNAPIDRFMRGDIEALSHDDRIGFDLFKKANCMSCHPAPLFTDNLMHNIGTEYATRGRIVDRGRAIVTNQAKDVGAFKTPTLRGIGRTAPYMHNGQMASLERVVVHFSSGGHFKLNGKKGEYFDQNIDPLIKRLDWTPEQQAYVVHFLQNAFEGTDYPFVGAP